MARAASYRDQALVIRTHDFGEADRIVVLLTREHEVVRAVAKGVRKTNSRFGSRLQPFVHLDVSLYPGKNLATIAAADTLAYLGAGIIEDWDRYAAACVVLETAERLAGYGGDDAALFDAAVTALHRLGESPLSTAVLDGFLLQSMRAAGWAPQLFSCAVCGCAGPHHAFHPAVGGAVCVNCRPSGSSEIPEEVLHLMWLLDGGYADAAAALIGSEGTSLLDTAHRLITRHLQWYVEAGIRSLKVMEQH
ncbi:DNA repair protein RecO [Corynebacterium uterequi]|uniref:DNA repair protein RecO n=1 Tax=Corynebacterium uterequi TaxID=1072256 RepID=A0A0G3HI25_9CORY|nr:DNA repair protein RecO [Corynebacterium uterequi]AKK11573.1 DNA replication and repair protein RecO [Corynebacterium uterequi]